MSVCRACGAEMPTGVGYCGSCGEELTQPGTSFDGLGSVNEDLPSLEEERQEMTVVQFVETAAGLRVCPGCGVVAPSTRTRCTLCDTMFAQNTPPIAPRSDGVFFVRVECRFECRECGQLSPLNFLDLGGTIPCVRCRMDHALELDAWSEGLAHAHAVGDLAGPDPEGRMHSGGVSISARNPFAIVGVTKTFAELQQSRFDLDDGTYKRRAIRVRASPGHPLCKQCLVVLEITIDQAGVTTTRCPKCSATATYQLPPSAVSAAEGLRGVICDEHRTDCPAVVVTTAAPDDTQSAFRVQCPNCREELPASEALRFVTCDLCGVESRVPSLVFYQLHPKQVTVDPWWLALEGPSPLRRTLERETDDSELQATTYFAKQSDAAAPLGAARLVHDPQLAFAATDVPLPPSRVATAAVRFPGIRLGPRHLVLAAVAGVAAIAVIVAVTILGFAIFGGDDRSDVRPSGPGMVPMGPAQPPSGDDLTDRTTYDVGPGCECQSDTDGDSEQDTLRLAARRHPPGVAYALDVGVEAPYFLPVGPDTAPPLTAPPADRAIVGMACVQRIVVFAAGDYATGWSAHQRRRIWTQALGSSYSPGSHATAGAAPIVCSQIRARHGIVRIPLADGRRIAIRAANGAVIDVTSGN